MELGIEFGQDLESLDILVNLFRLGSSELSISSVLVFKVEDVQYR